MDLGLNDLSKRILEKTGEARDCIKNKKEVNPKTLQQLVKDIGMLKKSDAQVQMSQIAPNLEEAIESLTDIETMLGKMKEKETDDLVQSIRKVVMGELEENARVEIPKIHNPHQFFRKRKVDLKNFLKVKQKVEKVYKPKTS
jgi:hypothetical protein